MGHVGFLLGTKLIGVLVTVLVIFHATIIIYFASEGLLRSQICTQTTCSKAEKLIDSWCCEMPASDIDGH